MIPIRGVRRLFIDAIRTAAVTNEMSLKEFTIQPEDQPVIKIRDRKFLAGSSSPNFPEAIPKQTSPYLKSLEFQRGKTDEEDLNQIGRDVRKYLDQCFDDKYDAVYIRNLPLTTQVDFDKLVKSINYRPMTYRYGTSYREKIEGDVYSASDEPPEFTIEPHNEMSYFSEYPTKIIICCLEAAEEGGDSPIVFNRDVIQRLDHKWIDKIREKGTQYIRNLTDENHSNYLTWQSVLETKSKEVAEELMKERSISWEWRENGNLMTWYTLDNYMNHPRTGEEIFFNQIAGHHCSYYKSHPMYEHQQNLPPNEYFYHSTYGDGEEFEDELIDHIRSISWHSAIPLKLQPGDVIVLDNFFAQHTRMSYSNGNRRIVLQLAESVQDVRNDVRMEELEN